MSKEIKVEDSPVISAAKEIQDLIKSMDPNFGTTPKVRFISEIIQRHFDAAVPPSHFECSTAPFGSPEHQRLVGYEQARADFIGTYADACELIEEPCPECGNEERGQGGYLICECPATISKG